MSTGRFPTYEAEERRRTSRLPGVEPVPLSATPAPALPAHIVDSVAAVLGSPMRTPPVHGLLSLRRALAGDLEQATAHAVDPESQILVTNGAMQALGVCFRSLLEPGDEVVVPAPCFFFGGPIRAAGAVPIYVQGSAVDGWRWDTSALEQAIGERTKALLLCNPGNPTGHVPSRQDVADAVAVAERNGLLVGSEAGDSLAGQLEAVGLPVVDGAAFQAPGYARLPFGGAAGASAALSGALDHWAARHAA